MSNSKYPKEYKMDIVKLVVDKGHTAIEVSKSTGVPYDTVAGWAREYRKHKEDAFPGKGKLHSEDEELRRLKKENEDLKEENAILKKAAAIFARPQK